MTEWVTDIVDRLGYIGVAFLVALESVFPPIPSEIILPLAGFVAGQGDANFVGMVLAATVGSLVGAWILYGISAAIGPVRLHRFIDRYGRWFGVKEADLVRAEEWFDRRSTYAVLFGRCVPLIRSIVRGAERNQYRFSSLVLGVVSSDAFQMNMKLRSENAAETREVAAR